MTETLDDMIQFDLRDRGITDERVLAAFRRVDRIHFVPQMDRHRAYDDRALILSHGQTLSQPYMVGLMTQALALSGKEKVLEIGTGSGYQTAILAALAREVYTVERIEYLATTAEDRLLDLGFTNVKYKLGDGSQGWPEHAPYDRIIVTAAAPHMPKRLVEQLADGGTIVVPVGPPDGQELVVGTRRGDRLEERRGTPCVFVKLIGSDGYTADVAPGETHGRK
ncbi:MAG TPA: protein-L-isoaspartate(D-aspartate) O-methyltransferase [Planctomycetota bacterium]|nr:protein-L-isoaspartate(D-aspartate) O-methyltransferase [Planctomycetota bacterium]